MFKQKKPEPKWHLLYDGEELIITNEKAMYEGVKYVVVEITADEAAQMFLAQQGKSQLRLTRPAGNLHKLAWKILCKLTIDKS